MKGRPPTERASLDDAEVTADHPVRANPVGETPIRSCASPYGEHDAWDRLLPPFRFSEGETRPHPENRTRFPMACLATPVRADDEHL